MNVECGVCGWTGRTEEMAGFYPEDTTYICKECFGSAARENPERDEKTSAT